jgi:hypothetical protein
LKLADVGMASPSKVDNLWVGASIVPSKGEISANVPAHGVVLLRLQK